MHQKVIRKVEAEWVNVSLTHNSTASRAVKNGKGIIPLVATEMTSRRQMTRSHFHSGEDTEAAHTRDTARKRVRDTARERVRDSKKSVKDC